MKVQIKVLNKEFYNKYNLPHYHTERSAAIDLFCTKNLLIPPQKSQVIYTGLAMWMGDSKIMLKEDIKAAALIIPRSGLGSRGLILRNLVGLIDEDYQGEIIVHMFNNSNDIVFINEGDRFAQMFFIPVFDVKFDVVDEFTDKTRRGKNGFGSTGK